MIELRANGTSKGPAWSGGLGEVKSLAGTQTTGLPLMPFEEWAEVRLVSSAGIVTLEGPGLEVLRQLEAIVDRLRRQLPSINPRGVELHEPPPPKPPEKPAHQTELALADQIDPKTGEIIAGPYALPSDIPAREWFAIHRPELKPGDELCRDKSGALVLNDRFGADFVPAADLSPDNRIPKRRGRPKRQPDPKGSFPLVIAEDSPLGVTLDTENPTGDDEPETHQPAI